MSSAPPSREARLSPPLFRDRAEAGLLLGEKVREVLGEAFSLDIERSRGSGIYTQGVPAQPGAPGASAPGSSAAGSGAPAGAVRVFAIPRGGVAVAAGVARCLDAVFPGTVLDVIVVRKIGHPRAPELGLGAVAETTAAGGGGPEPVYDDDLLAQVGLTRADLAGVVTRERAELARRMAVYHSGSAASGSCDVAVVVDDGLATGVTARAALRAVRARGIRQVVLAVPVAAEAAVASMEEELRYAETGEVVTLVTPRRFRSVGEWYADFGQLTDADVLTLLS
jgi:putative phosphoribosyl transferase